GRPAEPGCPPLGRLAASLRQHPLPDGDDESGLDSDVQEIGRLEQSAPRVLPAQKGFDLNDPAGIEGDDRLVEEQELLSIKRTPKLVLEPKVLYHAVPHLRVEDYMAAAPQLLGAVHCRVGVPDQISRALVRLVGQHNA